MGRPPPMPPPGRAIPTLGPPPRRGTSRGPGRPRRGPAPRAPWGWLDTLLALACLTAAAALAGETWLRAPERQADVAIREALDQIHQEQVAAFSHQLAYTGDRARLLPDPPEGMTLRVRVGAFADRPDYLAEVCLAGQCAARTARGPLGPAVSRAPSAPAEAWPLRPWSPGAAQRD